MGHFSHYLLFLIITLFKAEDEVLLIGEPGERFEISASFDGAYLLLSIDRDSTGVCLLSLFLIFVLIEARSIQLNKLWIAENKMSLIGPSLEWIKVKDSFDGFIT